MHKGDFTAVLLFSVVQLKMVSNKVFVALSFILSLHCVVMKYVMCSEKRTPAKLHKEVPREFSSL